MNLVAYFSCGGNTFDFASKIAAASDGDLYKIKPLKPYTEEDLNWLDGGSRSSQEMKDLNYRPAIVKDNIEIDKYEVIYLGFPIWWYIAPTIINTFLESYRFKNKKIVLFATAGSSGFGDTKTYLENSVDPSNNIIEGVIIYKTATDDDVEKVLTI